MKDRDVRVLCLVGEGVSSTIVINRLAETFGRVEVVEESRTSRVALIRGRLRRLGALRVADQLVFQTMVAPALNRLSRARVAEIRTDYGLVIDEPRVPISRVENVNRADIASIVSRVEPHVVVINGTRILAASLLASIDVPVINLHAGITPAYRGVHGGYWALREGQPALCGVTVHRVDAGIDTGAVIAQAVIEPTARDNFATYPSLQLGEGLPLLVDAVRAASAGTLEERTPAVERSRLYYHPGVTTWLAGAVQGRF